MGCNRSDETLRWIHARNLDPPVKPLRASGPPSEAGLTLLRRSLATQEQLKPLLVRPKGRDRYEVIDGSRRALSIQRRLTEEPESDGYLLCRICENYEEHELLLFALMANLGSEGVHPLDIADSVSNLLNHYDDEALAKALCLSPARLKQYTDLIHLPKPVLDTVRKRSAEAALRNQEPTKQWKISEHVLREFLSLKGYPQTVEEQIELMNRVFDEQLKSAEVKSAVDQILQKIKPGKRPGRPRRTQPVEIPGIADKNIRMKISPQALVITISYSKPEALRPTLTSLEAIIANRHFDPATHLLPNQQGQR